MTTAAERELVLCFVEPHGGAHLSGWYLLPKPTAELLAQIGTGRICQPGEPSYEVRVIEAEAEEVRRQEMARAVAERNAEAMRRRAEREAAEEKAILARQEERRRYAEQDQRERERREAYMLAIEESRAPIAARFVELCPALAHSRKFNTSVRAAFVLRSDGMTYAAIGKELGVCLERARQMVCKAERLMSEPWARRRLRFYLPPDAPSWTPETQWAETQAERGAAFTQGSPAATAAPPSAWPGRLAATPESHSRCRAAQTIAAPGAASGCRWPAR